MCSNILLRIITLLAVLASEVCGFSDVLLKLSQKRLSEDGNLTFPEISEKYGHPTTEYEIKTEDGYLLTVYRQPGDPKRPILLIHGNTPSGDCWIIRGNDSLSITLANLGYDVWVMNIRGTRYSRKHATLDPDRDYKKFFNYSFYEVAIHDVPAVVDFVLEETGQEQLIAIGHSVGTTLLYVLGAEIPEYNEKIKLGISLAPISFLQHLRGTVSFFYPLLEPLVEMLHVLNIEELFTYQGFGTLIRLFCLLPFGYDLCIKGILLPTLGYNVDGIERGYEATFFGHYPAGTTRKTFQHLLQIIKYDRFAKYDYGKRLNLVEYGKSKPPEFDLNLVTMKTALFVGKEDYLGTVLDAERLNASLPNVVHYEVLPYDKFGHVDFAWGRQMPELLFPYLLDVIKKYQ